VKHIISLGEVLIDLIPSTRVHLAETCYTHYPGGAIANVAIAIARLGGSSRLIGGVSDDEFGELLVRVLVNNHVDTHYSRVIKQAPTAIALITLDTQGQSRVRSNVAKCWGSIPLVGNTPHHKS
jgi:fructokinase